MSDTSTSHTKPLHLHRRNSLQTVLRICLFMSSLTRIPLAVSATLYLLFITVLAHSAMPALIGLIVAGGWAVGSIAYAAQGLWALRENPSPLLLRMVLTISCIEGAPVFLLASGFIFLTVVNLGKIESEFLGIAVLSCVVSGFTLGQIIAAYLLLSHAREAHMADGTLPTPPSLISVAASPQTWLSFAVLGNALVHCTLLCCSLSPAKRFIENDSFNPIDIFFIYLSIAWLLAAILHFLTFLKLTKSTHRLFWIRFCWYLSAGELVLVLIPLGLVTAVWINSDDMLRIFLPPLCIFLAASLLIQTGLAWQVYKTYRHTQTSPRPI